MFNSLFGGAFGAQLANYPKFQSTYEPMRQQQLQNAYFLHPQMVCVHPHCPICKEENEKLQKMREEKQTAYKNRCVEWMKKVGRTK